MFRQNSNIQNIICRFTPRSNKIQSSVRSSPFKKLGRGSLVGRSRSPKETRRDERNNEIELFEMEIIGRGEGGGT